MNADLNSLVIVEDNPADTTHYLRLLEEIDHGFTHIECVTSLEEAHERISNAPPSCCLLDYYLPDGSALVLLERLGNASDQLVCPIIIVTGQEDTEIAVKLLHHGAQDYLIKQKLDSEQLQRVIQHSIRTWKLQKQLNHMALYDPLTGLANRALFLDRLEQKFEESRRYHRHFALLYVDLDRFKEINDTFGHEAGDFLLKSVSERLRFALRGTDTAARLGGDEFAIILPDIEEGKAHHVAYKLVCSLTLELPWQDNYISIASSIGLATHPSKATSYQELMREADIALYRAKKNGRGRYSAFNKSIEEERQQQLLLSSALPRALTNKELKVFYQPIVNMQNHKIEAVEALIRWQFRDNWVPPEKVIDLILERRLSEKFHSWLFNTSIEQLCEWQSVNPNLKLALNLPANLCHDPRMLDQLVSIVKNANLDSNKLTVEVTETHLMHYPEESKQRLKLLADQGIQIAIDDFGTGYSSMQYLASLPCSQLKIDQQFFIHLQDNTKNAQIIEAITALSHRLGLKVVAEGVETKQIYKQARTFGCDFAQGYWIGAPITSSSPFELYSQESKLQGQRIMKAV